MSTTQIPNAAPHEWTPREVAERLRQDHTNWFENGMQYYERGERSQFIKNYQGQPWCGCVLGKLFHTFTPDPPGVWYQEIEQRLEPVLPLGRQEVLEILMVQERLSFAQIAEVLDHCPDWTAFDQAYAYIQEGVAG